MPAPASQPATGSGREEGKAKGGEAGQARPGQARVDCLSSPSGFFGLVAVLLGWLGWLDGATWLLNLNLSSGGELGEDVAWHWRGVAPGR